MAEAGRELEPGLAVGSHRGIGDAGKCRETLLLVTTRGCVCVGGGGCYWHLQGGGQTYNTQGSPQHRIVGPKSPWCGA